MMNSRILKTILYCLEKGKIERSLRWHNRDEMEFEVTFVHKKNRNWNPSDMDLAKVLDQISSTRFKKYCQQKNYCTRSKGRVRANLDKFARQGTYLSFRREIEIDRSTIIKIYQWNFSVMDIPYHLQEKEKNKVCKKKKIPVLNFPANAGFGPYLSPLSYSEDYCKKPAHVEFNKKNMFVGNSKRPDLSPLLYSHEHQDAVEVNIKNAFMLSNGTLYYSNAVQEPCALQNKNAVLNTMEIGTEKPEYAIKIILSPILPSSAIIPAELVPSEKMSNSNTGDILAYAVAETFPEIGQTQSIDSSDQEKMNYDLEMMGHSNYDAGFSSDLGNYCVDQNVPVSGAFGDNTNIIDDSTNTAVPDITVRGTACSEEDSCISSEYWDCMLDVFQNLSTFCGDPKLILSSLDNKVSSNINNHSGNLGDQDWKYLSPTFETGDFSIYEKENFPKNVCTKQAVSIKSSKYDDMQEMDKKASILDDNMENNFDFIEHKLVNPNFGIENSFFDESFMEIP